MCGSHDYYNLIRIRVDDNAKSNTSECFLHEIIEAIVAKFTIKIEHQNIVILSECLYQIFKDKISKTKLVAYLFGALGTTWVVFDGQWEMLLSFSLNAGDFIFLGGALSMCFYSISMNC